jgi:hypothetical protein
MYKEIYIKHRDVNFVKINIYLSEKIVVLAKICFGCKTVIYKDNNTESAFTSSAWVSVSVFFGRESAQNRVNRCATPQRCCKHAFCILLCPLVVGHHYPKILNPAIYVLANIT